MPKASLLAAARAAGLLLAAAIAGDCVGKALSQEGPCPSCSASVDAVGEAPFLAENEAAMDRMMAGMAAKPTGDLDRDFVAMMTPHHQGAIDMATVYLRHGSNPRLTRLAQEIIVTQQQEIAAMRIAIGDPAPVSAAAPTEPSSPATPAAPAPHRHDASMHMESMK